MIKSVSFIVLTQFFNFNELKILRQPGYFFKLNQQYIFYSVLKSLRRDLTQSQTIPKSAIRCPTFVLKKGQRV